MNKVELKAELKAKNEELKNSNDLFWQDIENEQKRLKGVYSYYDSRFNELLSKNDYSYKKDFLIKHNYIKLNKIDFDFNKKPFLIFGDNYNIYRNDVNVEKKLIYAFIKNEYDFLYDIINNIKNGITKTELEDKINNESFGDLFFYDNVNFVDYLIDYFVKDYYFDFLNVETFNDFKDDYLNKFLFFVNYLKVNNNSEYLKFLDKFKNFIGYYCVNKNKGVNLDISLYDGYVYNFKNELYNGIYNPKTAYLCEIYSKNEGGFFGKINYGLFDVYIPGSLAAANKILDFDSYVGSKIYVLPELYIKDSDLFIMSYKKYIKFTWDIAVEDLDKDKVYNGYVTGCIKTGVFIEWDNYFTGLLSVKEMSEDVLIRFNKGQIKPGDEIEVKIKSVDDKKRLILTNKNIK